MALIVAAVDVAGDTTAAGSVIVPAPVAIDVTAAAGLPGAPGAPGSPGTPGADGRAVEVAVVAGAIAWRYVGDVAWTNLVALTTLVGPAGADGTPGTPGLSVELQTTATAIQWRQTGGAWADLVALAAITGPQGPSGASTVQQTVLNAVDGAFTLALAPAFTLLAVAYSGACRLRLYRTAAGRTADTARAFTTPYTGGAGLLYDYLALAAETDAESPADGAYMAGETVVYGQVDGGPANLTITWVQTGA